MTFESLCRKLAKEGRAGGGELVGGEGEWDMNDSSCGICSVMHIDH